jgi:hypothetical protein
MHTPHKAHMGAAQPHIATHVSQNTIAGADKLNTHTAHAIGAPTGWRTTLHQTRLHDDMATYTPDTSSRKGPPSRPQALYPSPRISRDGYKCQTEHHCRCLLMGTCMLLDSAHCNLCTLKKKIAGADKLSTHTALSIGAPTAWRITLHQTQLHGCIHTRHTHRRSPQ